MITRILSALAGLAVVVPALVYGGQIAAEILVLVVMLVGIREFASMSCPDDRSAATWRLGVPGVAFYLAVLYGPPGAAAAVAVLGFLFLLISVLLRDMPVEDALRMVSRLSLGLLYVPGLVVHLALLRRFDDGLAWIALLLVITWAGDTGAYFAGRAFGKHKLYERISPKKTWEGAIGGAATAVLGALAVRALLLPEMAIWECLVLGVVLDTAGVLGDLTESMFKRAFGVKDSGQIMPGHGGILDRIDALLFTGPLLVLWLQAMHA